MASAEDPGHRFNVTAVFLEDAIHGRRSTHKIDATSLRLYRLYYNPTYTTLLNVVMALHLGVITLLEPADTCRGPASKSKHLTALLNLLFCALYTVDAVIQATFRGIPYVRYHTCLVILTMVCDSITSLCGVNCLWSRPLRPLVVIARLVNVRALCVSILRTIPKVLNVAVLLVFNLLVFTFLGHEIFQDSITAPNTEHRFTTRRTVNATVDVHSFSTFGESLDALFKLLTTVNFPDVMLPYYRANRWYALFFIVYLLIGLFFLSNLLLAVVYQYYREFTLERTTTRLRRRHRALQLAFRALSGHLKLDSDAVYRMNFSVDIQSRTWSSSSAEKNTLAGDDVEDHGFELRHLANWRSPPGTPAPTQARREQARSIGGVPSIQMSRSLNRNLRAGIQRQLDEGQEQRSGGQMRSVGTGLRSMVGLLSATMGAPSEAVSNAPLKEAPPAWLITEEQWTRLMGSFRPSLTPEVSCIMFRAVDKEKSGSIDESAFMDLCEYLSLSVLPRDLPSLRPSCSGRLHGTLQRIATHPMFKRIFDALVLLNTVLIIIQSFQAQDNQGPLHAVTLVLLGLFVLEMAVLLGGLGVSKFAQSLFNVLDLSSVVVAVASSIVSALLHPEEDSSSERIITIIRVVRLLRTLRLLKHFSSVISALGLMLPVLFRFGGLMILYMYTFAVIGMEAFAHRLTPENVRNSLYAVNDYFPSNFDDLINAMVTVFELLVVNNWNIIASGAVECCGNGSIAYFVLFYVTAVMIIMNVVVAFVLETFMSHWLSEHGSSDASPWADQLERAQLDEYGGKLKWDLRRKRRHSDVYKNIFKDELPQTFIRPWKVMHIPERSAEGNASEKQEPLPVDGAVRSFRNPVVEEVRHPY